MDVNDFNIKCQDYIREASSLVVQEKYGLHCTPIQFCDMASYYKNIVNPPLSIDPADSLPTVYRKTLVRFQDYVCQDIGPLYTPVSYGALYNGHVVNNVNGLAPAGWHVPTSSEFSTLLASASYNGGNLKEIGNTYWEVPNAGATNSLGFNARGTGERVSVTGAFSGLNQMFYLWSSDTYMTFANYYLYVYGNTTGAATGYINRVFGNPIRFIKNDSTMVTKFTDYDGNMYPVVKIGNQVWMATNLKVTHYANGAAIPLVTDNTAWKNLTTHAMCYYNNDINNV